MANVDIWNQQNKHGPTPKGSRPYFDSAAPHIRTATISNKAKPMLLTYREETKQPWRLIAGLPAPWVLSSAGKLIRYLHGSYFLPYHNTVSTRGVRKYRYTWVIHRGGTSLPRPVWKAFARGAAGGRVAARLQLSLVSGAQLPSPHIIRDFGLLFL